MFLRLTGVIAALFMSTTFAYAAMDPYALAQHYIDQGYTQIEVKVGTAVVKVEAVKERNRYEFTYNYQTGEMINSESAPLAYSKSYAYGEDTDDHSSSQSANGEKNGDDHGYDNHDGESHSGNDHSDNDD